MAFMSHDGETILGIGEWALCTRCGEGTLGLDGERRHSDDCPNRVTQEEGSLPTSYPVSKDPRVYVMTGRGITRQGR